MLSPWGASVHEIHSSICKFQLWNRLRAFYIWWLASTLSAGPGVMKGQESGTQPKQSLTGSGLGLGAGARFSLHRPYTGTKALQWLLRPDSVRRTTQEAFLKFKMLPQYYSSHPHTGSMKWGFKPSYASKASYTFCFPFPMMKYVFELGYNPCEISDKDSIDSDARSSQSQ